MLSFTDIALGSSTGSACRRCHAAGAATLRDTPEILADISGVVGSWAQGPGPNISLTGIEPFDHPDLDKILAAAVSAGAQRVRLDSDAAALRSPDTARAVLRDGVRHLQVRLLGSSPALHDPLSGRPGSFEAALTGVGAFAAAAAQSGVSVQVSARVPVCQHNVTDLPAIVTTAAKAHVDFVTLVVDDETMNLWAAGPWFEAACDTGIVHATWVEVEGVPFGPAAGWELHLASIYHSVAGEKSEVCARCPLDDVCSGAPLGAGESVTRGFKIPDNAEEMAACISRGYDPKPETDDD